MSDMKWFSSLESSGWLDIIRSDYILKSPKLCDLLVVDYEPINKLYLMSSPDNVSKKQLRWLNVLIKTTQMSLLRVSQMCYN